MTCSLCDQTLHVLPDSNPLFFHCESNHYFTLTDLLNTHLPDGTAETPTLDLWADRARALSRLATHALANKQVLMAADLLEAARRIDQRLRDLRDALSQSPAP